MIVDNSENPFKLVAEGEMEKQNTIHQKEIWLTLNKLAHGTK